MRLYDLASDPREETDLAARPSREAKRLKAALPRRPARAPTVEAADPALRSLGYLTGASGGEPISKLPDPHARIAIVTALAEGRRLREVGDVPRAASAFKSVSETDEGNPQAWFELGETSRRLGRFDAAAKALDRAIFLAPEMPEAWVARGATWLAVRRNDLAVGCFERALELSPSLVEAMNPMAAHYMDVNQPDRAFALIERAVAKGTANSDTYLMLGRIHLIQDRKDEAAQDFVRALELSPDPAATLKAEADVYFVRRLFPESIRLYEECIRRYPAFAPAYLTLAGLYVQGEKPELAVPLYRRALELELPAEDRANVEAILEEMGANR